MTFATLGLSPAVLRAVEALGYDAPTPVQCAAIPAALAGRHVWAAARTGSGKTAAFVLPLLDLLTRRARPRGQSVRALIVAPTRELAEQIAHAVRDVSRHLQRRIQTCTAIGGVSKNPQLMALRGGADVVVGTPGRVLELAADRALRLGDVDVLVLDEADRLLALGFADELARIVHAVPRRQRLLFSASFPPAVRALAAELLDDPVHIDVDAGVALAEIVVEQRAIEVDARRRTALLRHLVDAHGWEQVLVFVATRKAAEDVAVAMARAGVPAAALHGDLGQGARTQALAAFREKRLRVLVATDLAARGIDVTGLAAVVNYDLPRSATDYQHRIGRTSRAGATGTAVSFVTADGAAHFRLVEKRHRLRIAREKIPGFEPTDVAAPVRDPHGGVKGRRRSKKDKLRAAEREKKEIP